MSSLLNTFQSFSKLKKKGLALLLDPDKFSDTSIIETANVCNVDFVFVGGSLITTGDLKESIQNIKKYTKIPIVIFPGNSNHFTNEADAILLLNLISGRNPEYLIGQHVQAAMQLKNSKLEIISTSYILIDGGNITTVAYISNTLPIPNDKPDVAVATSVAGELIGHHTIYLDAGSGATIHVSPSIVKQVKANTTLPMIVGGGVRSTETATLLWNSGADILVVGNAIEKDLNLLVELSKVKAQLNNSNLMK